MERETIITEPIIPSRKEILTQIINSSKRVMERENNCFREIEINYSALAQGLFKKYEELVFCYPNPSSELLQELRMKIDNIQHLQNPHNNIKLVLYLSEILLNKEG